MKVSDDEYDRMCLAVLAAEELLDRANEKIAQLEKALFQERVSNQNLKEIVRNLSEPYIF